MAAFKKISKRIFLFLVVNILVMITVTTVLSFFGGAQMGGVQGLAVLCFVWGMVGSLISLLISRWTAKRLMGVQVIDPNTRQPAERELLETVYRLARTAGLEVMPEVGVYNSPEVNAFATGPTKNRALVAVSAGLLQSMDRTSLEGVLGHEMAHVANGDMVTLALIQGVMNAIVMFLARIVAAVITQNMRDEGRYMVRYMITIAFEIVFSLFGAMVVAYFSRHREFRADAGGARLAGREKMILALQSLQRHSQIENTPSLNAFKISGRPGGFLALLSTHPPLETRIARLQETSFSSARS